ncbi:hypothetical protein [Acinetobacter sp. ANC 4648]|uniref:hypothetical protein n=1 Tax=Acinetobacter sp. ANC 4648 TaxID=1977875 RepID=UPI000A32F9A5|nr:hypothetical protein [Acinetobacter sp. ANC 4648]OTG84945.1 peptide signal protein [Acinetobacter sp. ANC 4648]
MKIQVHKVIGLSLCLTCFAPISQAAVIKDSHKQLLSSVITEKQSPIEKALAQQKRGDNKLVSDNDQLKVLTAINKAPTQNFLAAQHQRFSRFVQALFQPHGS